MFRPLYRPAMDQSGQSRRHIARRDKTSDDRAPVDDDLVSGASPAPPHQATFLMESTAAGTRYVDVYRDALLDRGDTGGVILVDHDRLVGSLADGCAADDKAYRSLHRRAKAQLVHNDGRVAVGLMVRLVRQTIALAHRTARRAGPAHAVLTGFFDLAFVAGFPGAGFETAAVVELCCGKIRGAREKFESRATAARRAAAAAAVRRFWTGFRDALNTAGGAAAFRDVVVYRHECRYDAGRVPCDYERIIAAAAEFVLRDVARVQQLVSDVRAGREEFATASGPRSCALTDVNDVDGALRYGRAYADRLARVPEAAVTVALVVDAMLHAIDSDRLDHEWVDEYFEALTDGRDRGCADRPACVQYGDDCGLTAKRHKLQRTDYARSAVSVMRARWKWSLWRRRSLLTPWTEAEHDDAVAAIMQRLERDDDDGVDAQLCVLGLNRLQSNLDVFRGETVDLSGLGATDVTFRPTVIEPVGCATMVQMLDKEAMAYKRTSHAYFAPEDVMLVGFYDFCPMATTRRSSFDAVIPQRATGARDYFDFFHGKRTPKCFYVMDNVMTTSPSPTMTYHEDSNETCFQNGDSLTVTRRKWRFEPVVVCLTYKSERYEIIRHVVDGDRDSYDRLRIHIDSVGEYCVDKSHEGVIGFTGRLSDGGRVDVFTQNNGRAVCLLWQPGVSAADRDAVETSRLCEDGCVTIEYADQSYIKYSAEGDVEKKTASDTMVLHRRSKGGKTRGTKLPLESRKSRVTRSPIEIKKNRVAKTLGVSSKSIRNVDGTKTVSVITTVPKDSSSEIDTDSDNAQKLYADLTTVAVENSRDSSRKTVMFEDGTTITTHFRRPRHGKPLPALGEPSDVISYEYAHPAYKTVIDDRGAGMFRVSGVVTRSEDGAFRLPRWSNDPGGIDITTAAVVIHGGDGPSEPVATFGWSTAGDGVDDADESLFEKRDGRRHVSVMARRDPDKVHYNVTVIHDGEAYVSGVAGRAPIRPRPAAYFIVKRDMSGFAVPDPRRYDRFMEDVRGRRGTAIREYGRETVALFVAGNKNPDADLVALSALAPASVPTGRFAWLNPPFAGGFPGVARTTAADVDVLLADLRKFKGRLQLASRAFRKIDVDYGPLLDALRRHDAWPRPTARLPTVKMRVRPYVPDLSDVRALYVATALAAVTTRNQDHIGVATAAERSEKRERRRSQQKMTAGHARQALSRLASNSFIPYFHRDNYEPLRDSWLL